MEIYPEMDLSTIRMGTGETMVSLYTDCCSPSTQSRDYSQNGSYRQSGSEQPNNSAFRRSDNRPTTDFTPYEHKFPQNNNQISSNLVRFITTDDTINELSDLCPLNYKGLRTRTLTNLEIPDLASITSTSPQGTPKQISGLEIEFKFNTGASCSIINYRAFWEICQLQHQITIQKSTNVTKTYSGQMVPMIGYATITFSYDPDEQIICPLMVWITEMRTQNLLGMGYCQ